MLTASQIVQRCFNKEEEAQAFVSGIENVIDTRFNSEKDRLATKEDLAREVGVLRAEMKEQKSDIIKWMFIFWIGQIAATLAIILVFIKK